MPPDLDKNLTIYGRNPVLESLQDTDLQVSRIHLANSNRPAPILKQILALAEQRGVDVKTHDKQQLSRISRNGRQDQGVAADIQCPLFHPWQNLIPASPGARLIALDRVNNPQNLGMIIRSCCAAGITGVLLSSESGNTRLSPLVVKASTGTIFRTPIYRTRGLADTVAELGDNGYQTVVMAAGSGENALMAQLDSPTVFILGNETDGVSETVRKVANSQMHIPMANHVESLNLAVTASLLAFI